jgi:glycosyltransferase involved in cell wall biosynthesis
MVRERLRIAFFTTDYPTPSEPTTGIFIKEHARAASLHCDVVVVHLLRAPAPSGLFAVERVADEDPPLLRVRYRRYPRPFSYLAFIGGAVAAFRALRAGDFDPDVLHAHSHLSALPALVLGRTYRKPLAYTEHLSVFLPDNPSELSLPMRVLARLVLRGAQVVLPVSEAMRRSLALLAPRAQYRVVPNAVDEEIFHPEPDHGPREPPWRLLTVGMLTENRSKGIDILLEALAVLVQGQKRIRLDVVGDGPRRAEYEQLAQRLGVDHLVSFHGLESRPQVAERMRTADLFVLASRFENNPCAVLEALTSGLPVVATRVGGIPEIVDDTSGLLAQPRSPDSLAERISAAVDSIAEFDRPAIARRARERYGAGRVGKDLAEVYSRCVGSARSITRRGTREPRAPG